MENTLSSAEGRQDSLPPANSGSPPHNSIPSAEGKAVGFVLVHAGLLTFTHSSKRLLLCTSNVEKSLWLDILVIHFLSYSYSYQDSDLCGDKNLKIDAFDLNDK